MAQTLPIELCSGQLISTVPTNLYIAPASALVTIRRAVFSSLLTVPVLLTVQKFLADGVTNFTLINQQPISAGEQFVAAALANLVLKSGESIKASASVASSLNAFISGFQSQ
jgi:hypothetical protein